MAEREVDDATEGQYNQIRNLINQNKIKLWEEPYFKKDTGSVQDENMLELACNLSPTLDMDSMFVLQGLKHWQSNALSKLEAREKLKSAGTIMLKLKIAKNLLTPDTNKENVPSTVEVRSSASGTDLADAIGALIGADGASLRLISGGKVLAEDKPIDSCLRPGSVVMAVRIDRSDQQWETIAEQRKILRSTRHDADILGSGDGDGGSVEITDQSGKRMELPNEERKALIMAMSFHEKGRASLKRKNYELALVLLLEALGEYQTCRSELLKGVDNYALLNLDVAWCYLKLGNMSELPNAEERLSECEANFARTYGANLERLVAVKGSAENERALYLRMHLMQGIVAYHQGHRQRAADLLARAETELKALDVPDDALAEVVALGYSEREARLALRAEAGNVTAAVRLAQRRREERERVEREEAERKRKRREYGKTPNGHWVNLGYVKTLENMGFPEMYVVAALRQTENDINAAMDAIQNNPELLEEEAMKRRDYEEERDDMIAAFKASMSDRGAGEANAEGADKKKILEQALVSQARDDSSDSSSTHSDEADTPDGDARAGKRAKTTSAAELTEAEKAAKEEARKKRAEERKVRQEAIDRMQIDIGHVDGDDHLDLTLDEEREFLKRYLEFLQQQQRTAQN